MATTHNYELEADDGEFFLFLNSRGNPLVDHFILTQDDGYVRTQDNGYVETQP